MNILCHISTKMHIFSGPWIRLFQLYSKIEQFYPFLIITVYLNVSYVNTCYYRIRFQIRSPKDETICEACSPGTIPDTSHQNCTKIPESFLRAGSSWAIGAMTFSILGAVVTLLVISVFIKHNHTPIVKAAGREVSYVLLSGLLLCYLITFVLILKPTDIVCAIQRYYICC